MRLFKCLAVLLSVTLVLVGAEYLLRVMHYRYSPVKIVTGSVNDDRNFLAMGGQEESEGPNGRLYTYDPVLFWRPVAGRGRINLQGYLGDCLAADKTPGSYRIFTFGDSNTIGLGRPSFANWPADLEALARRDHPTVTVTNAGVDGYTAFQGLRRLREALPYRPDMVLVCFGANDAKKVYMSDADYAENNMRRLEGGLRLLLPLKLGQVLLGLLDHTSAFAVRLGASGDLRVPRVDIKEYRAQLEQMVRLCQENKIELVLLTRPYWGVTDDRNWWKFYARLYNREVREVAASHDVRCVDLFKYFRHRENYFFPIRLNQNWVRDESHFGPNGHQEAAQFIYDAIHPSIAQALNRSGNSATARHEAAR